MIVVDASAMVESLLRFPGAAAVDKWLFSDGQVLHAPHLLDIEVASAVRRCAALRLIDADRGRAALANLAAFPLHRHSHTSLLSLVWGLRSNLTAYDAIYVALAEALTAPLLTRDSRFAKSAGQHVRVELA